MKREKGSEVILIGEEWVEWGEEEEEEEKKDDGREERNGRVEVCNSIKWGSILRSVFLWLLQELGFIFLRLIFSINFFFLWY